MRKSLLLAVLLCGCGTGPTVAPQSGGSMVAPAPTPEFGSVEAALAGPHRSAENRARDVYRHPAETLAFFGLEPTMTVIEIWPGGGWYTEVLAPTLRGQGRLIAATLDPEDQTFRGRFARQYRQRLADQAAIYDQVETVVLYPPDNFDLGTEVADMVLSFRSVHNWIRWGGYQQQVFEAVARALKPGGIFGIVQHRAPEGDNPVARAETGYVPQAYIIELATGAAWSWWRAPRSTPTRTTKNPTPTGSGPCHPPCAAATRVGTGIWRLAKAIE